MRDPYVPFFKDLLSSGVWFEDPAVRCVWIALVLNADAEGYVRMNLRALQREANVPLDDVKRALEIFAEPDPESRDQTLEGRRVVAVDRGWGLVTFEAHRRRARLAAEAARKARWDREHRRAPSDSDAETPSNVGTRRLSDAQKQKQKPKQKQTPPTEEGEAPRAPLDGHTREDCPCGQGLDRFHPPHWCGFAALPDAPSGVEGTTLPAAYHTLDGWSPTEEDIAHAEMAGLPRAEFLECIAKARLLPRLGGQHGIRDRGGWVRLQVPTWKRWRDERLAKPSFGRAPEPPPKPKPPRVKGCPEWVRPEHEAMCKASGHDVRREAAAFAKGHHIPPSNLKPADAATLFSEYLARILKGAA